MALSWAAARRALGQLLACAVWPADKDADSRSRSRKRLGNDMDATKPGRDGDVDGVGEALGELRVGPRGDAAGGGEREQNVPVVGEREQNVPVDGEHEQNVPLIEDGEQNVPLIGDRGQIVPSVGDREQNLRFIGEALDMARLALRTNETPVGCVLVHDGVVVARGMNATNVTRNGTRHAELMAIAALLSVPPAAGPRTTSLKPAQVRAHQQRRRLGADALPAPDGRPDDGNEDGAKSHLFPYGQKLAPGRVDAAVLRDCVLYVTVEPCVMCASLLRQLGIRKVYFGAVNDKFGGTGGVFSIHANSLPAGAAGAAAHPLPPPAQLPDGRGTLGTSYPPGGGDGGNVEPGYEIEGGWGRDEAVGLLRRFYVQENGRAPVPRKKEGRAARLAAMMDRDGSAESSSQPGARRRGSESSSGPDDMKENLPPRDDKSDSDDAPSVDDDYLGLVEGQLRGGFGL